MKRLKSFIYSLDENPGVFVYCAIAGALISFGLMKYFYINSVKIICPLMALALTFLLRNCIKIKDKTVYFNAAFFAALLALSFIIGDKIDTANKIINNFYLRDIGYFLILFFAGFILSADVLRFIRDNRFSTEKRQLNIPWWVFVLLWLIMLGLHARYFLTYYPACLTVDSYDQIKQALGLTQLSNHHPVLYTAYLKLCISVGDLCGGDINTGLAIAAGGQLLAVCAVLTHFVRWIYKKNAPLMICAAVYLFFAFNAYIGFYAITLWKDVFFSLTLLIFCMQIYDIICGEKDIRVPKNIAALFAAALLLSFLRNNGIYIAVISLTVLIFCLKNRKKAITALTALLLITVMLIQGPLYASLNIKKAEAEEALAIPLQQIGYVLQNSGRTTAEQNEFINKLLPVKIYAAVYDPLLADSVKFNDSFDADFLEGNKGQFLKIWLQMMVPNFGMYVKAYLLSTVGFWHMGTTNWMIAFGASDEELGIEARNIWRELTGIDGYNSMYYEADASKSKQFFGDIYSIAFLVWVGFFYIAVMNVRRKRKFIASAVPLYALWLSVMAATPVYCEFRYVYAYFLCFPFLLTGMFMGKDTEKENE